MVDLQAIKGIGPKLADQLNGAGINTVADLQLNLPRTYIDYTNLNQIAEIEPGMVAFKCRLRKISANYVKNRLHITRAQAYDDSGAVNLTWFNQPYRSNQLREDAYFYVSGEYKIVGRYLSIANPSLTASSEMQKAGIQPVYSQKNGIKPSQFAKIVPDALRYDAFADYLPTGLLERHVDLSLSDAVRIAHQPANHKQLHQAQQAIGHMELLRMALAAELNRQEASRIPAPIIELNIEWLKNLVSSLPFTLTDDQRRSVWHVLQSLAGAKSQANLLINGDVGSGKTVIAFIAAMTAVKCGLQAAIIAPTEVLAKQHFTTIVGLVEQVGSESAIQLLTGSTSKAERTEMLDKLASGSVDLIIGTHSLLEPRVAFSNLGLVIVDEQHRFGVKQRNALKTKTKLAPHMISMTATPIPRSLLLTLYGELDVSLIKEKPPGRQPIETSAYSPSARNRVYTELAAAVKSGHQAALVAPKIEENKDSAQDSLSVEEVEKLFKKHPDCKGLSYAILHGRLKADEKDQIITDFAAGAVNVLISTTVIEVGVDVPNLNFMVIESAERFGLAQLHQLRGRVARRDQPGRVVALTSREEYLGQRLRKFASTNDGFELARFDLETRGPGEVYGTAQSGGLGLLQANLLDLGASQTARTMAEEFARDYQLADYPQFAKDVAKYQKITALN